jgi:hypothetical protein
MLTSGWRFSDTADEDDFEDNLDDFSSFATAGIGISCAASC